MPTPNLLTTEPAWPQLYQLFWFTHAPRASVWGRTSLLLRLNHQVLKPSSWNKYVCRFSRLLRFSSSQKVNGCVDRAGVFGWRRPLRARAFRLQRLNRCIVQAARTRLLSLIHSGVLGLGCHSAVYVRIYSLIEKKWETSSGKNIDVHKLCKRAW